MPSVEQGAIKISTANAMGNILNKKMGVSTGFAPKDWADTLNLCGKAPEKTVSGAIAHITDGADRVPVKNWQVTLGASLTGYSSLNCAVSGKNFIDDNLSNLEQGSIESAHGNNTTSSKRVRNANYTPFPYDEICSSYKLTIPAGWRLAMRFFKADNTYVSLPSWAVGFVSSLPSELVGQGVEKVRFVFAKTDESDITPEDVKNIGYQIEVGSTATAYEAYQTPTTHTAQLGRTIYGGTADVVTGEGTDENGNDFTFTPISPTPETALGVNNFWADEGDSQVTYRRDIDLALGG